MKPHRNAFTLIELLVVVAIISLLVSILLPSLSKAKSLAQKVVCLSNEKQITMALLLYANENKNYFPVAWGNDLPTWVETLAPYYTQDTTDISDDPGWQDPARKSEPSYEYAWGTGNYRAIGGNPQMLGLTGGRSYLLIDARFGTNDSFDLVKNPTQTVWMHCCNYGANFSYQVQGMPGMGGVDGIHLGQDNYAFVDGHVDSYDVQPIVDNWEMNGSHTFHYSPQLSPNQAEWWIFPWLPDAPLPPETW